MVHGIDNHLPSPISIGELDGAGVDSKDRLYRCSEVRLLGELHPSPYEIYGRSNLATKRLARLLLVRSVVDDPQRNVAVPLLDDTGGHGGHPLRWRSLGAVPAFSVCHFLAKVAWELVPWAIAGWKGKSASCQTRFEYGTTCLVPSHFGWSLG
jgi:hypothetical protein